MNVGNGVCAATHLMYPAKSFISSSVGLNTGIRPGMAPYVAIVPSDPLHGLLSTGSWTEDDESDETDETDEKFSRVTPFFQGCRFALLGNVD
jgi:hypothetical protein